MTDEVRWLLVQRILTSHWLTSDRQRVGAIEAVLASRAPFAMLKPGQEVPPLAPRGVDSYEVQSRKVRAQQRRRAYDRLQMAKAILKQDPT